MEPAHPQRFRLSLGKQKLSTLTPADIEPYMVAPYSCRLFSAGTIQVLMLLSSKNVRPNNSF